MSHRLRRTAWPLACGMLSAIYALSLLQASSGQNRQERGAEPKRGESKAPSTWVIQYAEAEHSDKTGEGQAKAVVVTTDEGTVLHADRFAWNDRTRVARAEGNLRVVDPEADATGSAVEIQYARSKRLLILTGGVRLTIKPRQETPQPTAVKVEEGAAPSAVQKEPARGAAVVEEPDEDEAARLRKYPIEVTCDRLEYQYARDKKQGVLRGNFRAVQKLDDRTRTLTADHAEWFGREDLLVLKAPVKWEDTKGNSGASEHDVRIYTRRGEERLLMKSGTLTIIADDDEEQAPSQSRPPAQAPARPGEPGTNGPAAPRGGSAPRGGTP